MCVCMYAYMKDYCIFNGKCYLGADRDIDFSVIPVYVSCGSSIEAQAVHRLNQA